MERYRTILQEHWGYATFRPLQEEIIRSVVSGADTLALMPTGGGKSITFQVPALASPGVSLVITPLISLMTDQVERLKAQGIKAVAVHSGLTRIEVDIALDNCIYGDVKLLYLSPERLSTDLFLTRLAGMKVNLIAVDEAHCISQWGYDFRPSYLQIASIRDRLPGVPVLALTATATGEVATDIMRQLRFKNENVIRQSFERKNLAYLVRQQEDKPAYMLKIFARQKGAGIVYVRSRKKTRDIAEFLTNNGIKAECYHAGLDPSIRKARQEAWMKGKITVMVATNAFGMGIDKEDVRVVVHHDLPDSPEAYFQEAGRAGRDGRKSYAVLLYHPSDKQSLEQAYAVRYPEIDLIRKIYHALGNYFQVLPGAGKGLVYDFNLMDFCIKFRFHNLVAYHALKHMERAGFIELTDEIYLPSRVHFKIDRDDLYKFQVANDRYDGIIRLLLRAYSGMFTDFVRIDEATLAKKAGVSPEAIVNALENLGSMGVLHYLKPKNTPQLIWTSERLQEKSLLFPVEDYEKRKKSARERLQFMIGYASSDHRCRSQLLLGYFGEGDPYRCRQCDVCMRKHESGLNRYEYDQIRDKLLDLLSGGPVDRQELFARVDALEDKVVMVLSDLLDKKVVTIMAGRVIIREEGKEQGAIF